MPLLSVLWLVDSKQPWSYIDETSYTCGARCRLSACGSADATATTSSHASLKPERFAFLVSAYPGCPKKDAVKQE